MNERGAGSFESDKERKRAKERLDVLPLAGIIRRRRKTVGRWFLVPTVVEGKISEGPGVVAVMYLAFAGEAVTLLPEDVVTGCCTQTGLSAWGVPVFLRFCCCMDIFPAVFHLLCLSASTHLKT